MRLCNSRLPEEHFVCYQTSQRNWVIIKELYKVSPKVNVGLAYFEIRICHSDCRRGISGPSR